MKHLMMRFGAKLRFAGVMATVAHVTTAVTFSSAIYAFFFPDVAAYHIARLAQQVEAAAATLDGIGADTRATADATGLLAAALADRPRFSAQRRAAGLGRAAQVQLRIDNPTARTVTDLMIIAYDAEGKAYSNLGIFVLPPFEGMTDIIEADAVEVCYSYFTDETRTTRVTELRRFEFLRAPTVDASGNASTHDALPLGYDIRIEPDPAEFLCGNRLYEVEDFRAESARRRAAR
jgi:hypothetical protein